MKVASVPIPKDRAAVRIAIVERHIRSENEHDLEGVLGTFGEAARYDDEPWGEHYEGRDGVRSFYQQLMAALPDLVIDVQRQHVTDDAILVEVIIRGTHLGGWRGLPPTGRRVEIPLCGVYTFDSDDRLAGKDLRSGDGIATTRCVSRAAECFGTTLDSGDAPGHDCTGFVQEARAELKA